MFRKPRRELCVDDVTRHLAFAFNEFLERQKNKEGVDENKQSVIRQAKELISSAFDLPEDDTDESLKVGTNYIYKYLSKVPYSKIFK